MNGHRRVVSVTRIRRVVQIVFLLLFFVLVLLARPRPDMDPGLAAKSFFLFDPLILIVTWLAAHAVPVAMLLSLVVIATTAILGRVFCGWVCPLGTIHAVVGRLFDRWYRKPKPGDRWSPWQRTKYYLLAGLLVMAAFGSSWVCVFDPIVLLYRTTTVALLPSVQWAVEEGSTTVYQHDPGAGPVRLSRATEPAYRFLRDNVFVVPKQAFLGSGLIVTLFIAMLLLNGYRRRFWCRYLCPLGALLGLFAWRPMLRRQVEEETCNPCDRCGAACRAAAAEEPPRRWKPSECLVCFDCTDSCRRDALGFKWTWPWRKQPAGAAVGLSRRAALGAALGGVVTLSLMRSNPQSRGETFHPDLIRPPGAKPEPEFLQRCTACGLCMKICPTGGLQPSFGEAGLEGIWTPKLVPRIGYCDYNCNRCGQICPTEAITPLVLEAKQQTRIGLACFDTTRCIPYAFGRDCLVCEEHCPIPDKAIYFLEVEVHDRNGRSRTIKQPRVDPDLCTGCGICENVCVFKDRPAIRVSSANETRNPANQPILPGEEFGY
jgi:MauM/NapG family ferredoxin protein